SSCSTERSHAQHRMKYWELIADNLKKAGCSWGYVSTLDASKRTIWIVDAHRGDGKRFVVRADAKLTAFAAVESATRARGAIVLDEQIRFFPKSASLNGS